MNYRPHCIPCLLKRTLHTAARATSDEWLQRKLLGEIMAELSRADMEATPAELVQQVFRKTARTLGLPDPYAEEKRRFREEVLSNADWIRARVEEDSDPFFAALKLSIAANQLDNELGAAVTLRGLVEGLGGLRFEPERLDEFRDAARRAEQVLFIHDSAGELFFDRLLIERLAKDRAAVTSVVRQAPSIADATLEDAEAVGLPEVVGEVIDPGTDCQGLPLDECSEELRARYNAADLVVGKGQAVYQTLEGRGAAPGAPEKEVYFLLSVKCPVMASHFGVGLRDLVLERG